jgi:hypothetical protein
MPDYIFTQGTCLKSEFFSVLKGIFTAAGWVDISSNAATDFTVMSSTGEGGDKALIFQMRETNLSNANSIVTTNYSHMTVRLPGSYTPGTTGVAGTFARAAEIWRTFAIIPVTASSSLYAPNTPLTYYYHANKNRVIIIIESPATTGIAPVIHYFGLPDVQYASEPASRGLLYATSALATLASNVLVTDTPGEAASEIAAVSRPVQIQLTPKNPNAAGKYHISDIFVGDVSEGLRFNLSGLYALPNQGIVNGDIITVGTKKFRVVLTQAQSNSSFNGTNALIGLAHQIPTT